MKSVETVNVQSLAMDFLVVAQNAAIASYPWVGRGNKVLADGAGTEAMRDAMNKIKMEATIVIGEGEMDEAPMLFIGEKLGFGTGVKLDIAVDPVEGTTLMSKGQENSLCVIAAAAEGSLLHAPDMYMEKIAVGPKAKGCINLDLSLMENMRAVAKALNKDVSELTVTMQDRPRHQHLMEQVFALGARVQLFSDVDITAAIATAIDESEVDLMVGTGGAPEGVISAVALQCLGGDFQAKLVPQNEEEKERCEKMGIEDVSKRLTMQDIVRTEDCFFVATGITNGALLKGVRTMDEKTIQTHSFLAVNGKHYQFIEANHFNN